MRKLSDTFFNDLKSGFLSSITENVNNDHDLNLEIRKSYINVYYKGNSLLKLSETSSSNYKADIHKKFLDGVDIPPTFSEITIPQFINAIPLLKQNIIKYGERSLEVEYEQMIIRANNYESRCNTEYFIVDRQYTVFDGRFDLTGIFWNREGRKKNQKVPVCLMEIKFALNTDIKEVHNQLNRYYQSIKSHAAEIASEMQDVFRKKLELGLYHQPQDRLNALKTLTFSENIDDFQFIVVLVDYNQNSTLLDLKNLAHLTFASQVKVFFSGFAMWKQNVKSLSDYL